MQRQNGYGSASGRKPGYLGGGISGPSSKAVRPHSADAQAPSSLAGAERAAQAAGYSAPSTKHGSAPTQQAPPGYQRQNTASNGGGGSYQAPPPGLNPNGPRPNWGATPGPTPQQAANQGLQDILAQLAQGPVQAPAGFNPSSAANAPQAPPAKIKKPGWLGIGWGWWAAGAAITATLAAAGTGYAVYTRKNRGAKRKRRGRR